MSAGAPLTQIDTLVAYAGRAAGGSTASVEQAQNETGTDASTSPPACDRALLCRASRDSSLVS